MTEDSFIEKYTKDEKIKRGIEVILKSDKYTDEYKALILKYLGENYSAPSEMNTTPEEQLELMDKGGIVIKEGTTGLVRISDKKPASRGKLETPKYLESELVKAIDIVVDELITPPPKQSPPTVPLQTYLDLETAYSSSVNDTEDFRERWLNALSDLDLANLTIATLNQSLDACEIQRAVAENQADIINTRYISLLGDFQSAIQKAIQEAIERVSLTAQVRGLQAQKELLKVQLDLQIKQLQLTLETKYMNSNIQKQVNLFAYKIPQYNITDKERGGFYFKWNEEDYNDINGQQLVFYNFTTEPKNVTVTKTVPVGVTYTGALGTIDIPSSFTIPAGTEWNTELQTATSPGATSLTIGVDRPGDYKVTHTKPIRRYPNVNLNFEDNLNNKLVVSYSYERGWKVHARASGNPGPKNFQLDEGVDYTN